LVVVFGESGSGKSFLVLDLIGAVCQGKPWRERQVRPGRCVYIAAEAAAGFRNRMVAYCTENAIELSTFPLGVVPAAPNLLNVSDVKGLMAELKAFGRIDVLVVDTFAQVTPGANENAAEDVGKAIAHCRVLHRHTGATVILIHHAGKDLTKGARGWSGLRAAADAEIEISRRNDERTATITKQKDGSDGTEFPFRLSVVEIGQDEEGEDITSCVVVHEDRQPLASKREPSGTNERILWRLACDLGDLTDGEVPVGTLIDEAVKQMPHDPQKPRDQRRANAKRALESLAEKGFVTVRDDVVKVSGT
jgi:putative DNA primase/helicase